LLLLPNRLHEVREVAGVDRVVWIKIAKIRIVDQLFLKQQHHLIEACDGHQLPAMLDDDFMNPFI
jgi:hypothetical protein